MNNCYSFTSEGIVEDKGLILYNSLRALSHGRPPAQFNCRPQTVWSHHRSVGISTNVIRLRAWQQMNMSSITDWARDFSPLQTFQIVFGTLIQGYMELLPWPWSCRGLDAFEKWYTSFPLKPKCAVSYANISQSRKYVGNILYPIRKGTSGDNEKFWMCVLVFLGGGDAH